MALLNGWAIRDTSTGPLTEDDQRTAATHRADAGRPLTDQQYDDWLNGK